MAAATLLTGADPKTPPKKRVIMIAAGVLEVAVPIENRAKQNMAGSMLTFRPHTYTSSAFVVYEEALGPWCLPH